MATDTVAKIKEAEGKYRRDCDDAVRESADAVNRTKSDCDVRLTEARAECEREFDAARERADEEATKTSVLAEPGGDGRGGGAYRQPRSVSSRSCQAYCRKDRRKMAVSKMKKFSAAVRTCDAEKRFMNCSGSDVRGSNI